MQTAEMASYKILGGGGRMAKWITAAGRMAGYGFFKKRLRELAKEKKLAPENALKNQSLVEEAAKFSSHVMLDYNDLPHAVQFMRSTGIAPFIAYPWRATRYYIEYPFRKNKSYLSLSAAQRADQQLDTQEDRLRRRSRFPNDFMYPAGRGLRNIMNRALTSVGADPYEELNISGRFWSPVPRIPEEALGLSVDRFQAKGTTIGEDGATWADKRSVMRELTEKLGLNLPEEYAPTNWKGEPVGGIPLPDPMAIAPLLQFMSDKKVGSGFDKRDPTLGDRAKRSAYEFLPPYMGKLDRESLYGVPIKKRDLISQAVFGLRVLPKTHRKAAFDRGQSAIKKLRGEPRYKGSTYSEQMRMEEEALRRQSRLTLF